MSEDKKECSSHGGSCCSCVKFIIGLLVGAFIFASGMWFAKSQCCAHMGASGNFCPFSAPVAK